MTSNVYIIYKVVLASNTDRKHISVGGPPISINHSLVFRPVIDATTKNLRIFYSNASAEKFVDENFKPEELVIIQPVKKVY